jgi:hypothetical protein
VLLLFALSLILILVAASIVIDLGVLRNDRQTLVNAVDAAALAGGALLPVDGAVSGAAAKVTSLVDATIKANYPGLPGSAYTISYRCLVGVTTGSPPKPWISRDIPIACDPSGALGWTGSTTLAQKEAAFQGAGPTRFSACDPSLGDKCNVVVVTGEATTPYSFGRVVGVDSGSTGTIVSAACNGPCGQPPASPVDLVVLVDRTASMSATQITNARNAAKAILGVYDPALQRVAIGFLGPSEATTTCNGSGGGPAVGANAITSGVPPAPQYGSNTRASNASSGAATLSIAKPSGVVTSNILVAGVTVAGGTGVTVTAPSGWTLIDRTDTPTSTTMSLLTYHKVITSASSEPGTYTWSFSPSARAAGGIIRYGGVNTSSPIDVVGEQNGTDTSSPFRPTAPSVNTTTSNVALIGFLGLATGTNFSGPSNGMTERFDVRNADANGPSIAGVTKTDATAGASGTTSSDASAGGQYAAQHVALKPNPANQYGTAYPADLAKWIPVGFTGIDTDNPAPAYAEAYVDANGILQNTSHIVSAINCFDNPGGTGTNLATPVYMAAQYLKSFGRPNVKWGILFETDGEPSYGNTGDPSNYTCAAALSTAAAAKTITNAAGKNIELFTVGFFDPGADPNCPDTSGTYQNKNVTLALSHMASTSLSPSPDGVANGCVEAENSDQDHFFCQPKDQELQDVFKVIAAEFAGLRSHLVELYPPPAVTAVNPTTGTHLGGVAVTITGKYFTGATRVDFGSIPAPSFAVLSDTAISVVSPAGATGSTVEIRVTTPGGTSPVVAADRYTFN